jgi:hypothetical protein
MRRTRNVIGPNVIVSAFFAAFHHDDIGPSSKSGHFSKNGVLRTP